MLKDFLMHACSEHIELEDLQIFLPEEQAKDCLESFDCDADGHISAEDMREAVLQVIVTIVKQILNLMDCTSN